MVGNTPIVLLEGQAWGEVYIKLEGNNPTGSVKDRAALAIINSKIKSGAIREKSVLLDASSGSFACSMAYFGKILRIPVTVVTSSKITQDKKEFIKYFGATDLSHGDFTIEANQYCHELVKQNGAAYCFLDQLHNWDNPRIHYETTGPEILSDLPDVDIIVFSLGSGGTLHGVARYLKEKKPGIKIVAVSSASGTKIPGAGSFVDGDYETPFIKEALQKSFFDLSVEVDFETARNHVKYLRERGFYVGLQSGSVYQGMLEAVDVFNIKGKILIISGDAGWKNSDRLRGL